MSINNGRGPICIHKRFLRNCRLCHGSAICIHQREKYRCSYCMGAGSCIHKHDKRYCLICTKTQTPAIIKKISRKTLLNKPKIQPINKKLCKHGYVTKMCCICEYKPVKLNYKKTYDIEYKWIYKNTNKYNINYSYLQYQFYDKYSSKIKPPLRLSLFRRDRVVDFLNKYRKRH